MLFLTSRYPWPLEKGDKLRAYHLIRTLSEYADIYLFAIAESKPDQQQLSELSSFCKGIEVAVVSKPQSYLSVAKSILSSIPFQAAYFYTDNAMHQLQDFNARVQPDAMICHLLRMAPYALNLPVRPSLIDYMDTFSKGMERYAASASTLMKLPAQVEARRLSNYEYEIFTKFDFHTIISAQDRSCIPHPLHNEIDILPNGVDLEYYSPRNAAIKQELIFLGNMAYAPNIASVIFSVKKIIPELEKLYPGARFLIAGASPVKEVQALASSKVKVSGWMEDVRDTMAASRVMIAPMLISIGLQNKILQAMAMKIPCVVSSLANNAIGAVHGKHILVADTPEQYAKCINDLLCDDQLHARIADNAYDFVHASFNWDEAGKLLAKRLEL